MKKTVLALSLASLFISATVLAAPPVVNLKVSGDIKPPTCMVNGSEQNDVIFDFGVISPSTVPQSFAYKYPTNVSDQEKDILIQCDAETYLTFKATDIYESSDASNIEYPSSVTTGTLQSLYFRLVPVNNPNLAMGGVLFVVKSASVDDNETVISRANDGIVYIDNVIGSVQFNQLLMKQATMTWTKTNENGAAPDNLTLIPGQNFKMSISTFYSNQLPTFITSQDALMASGIDIADGLDFMGETVLTFNFGV